MLGIARLGATHMQAAHGNSVQMNRLSLSAPRGITFALLLAYIALAAGGSFLHTCGLQGDEQGQCAQAGLATQHATSLPVLDRALVASHHHDCLACLWGSSNKQHPGSPDSASAPAPSAPHRLLTQLPYSAPSVYDPSGIRGPPQL